MKLKSKQTGEIMEFDAVLVAKDVKGNEVARLEYDSIQKFTDQWEDVPEEPKRTWFIDTWGSIRELEAMEMPVGWEDKPILEFETKEEAEKALKKLKAITRLNKCGFRFEGYTDRDRASGGDIVIYAHVDIPNNNLLEEAQPDMLKDLDLLFSGEDD